LLPKKKYRIEPFLCFRINYFGEIVGGDDEDDNNNNNIIILIMRYFELETGY
jgi:hypothetical protein